MIKVSLENHRSGKTRLPALLRCSASVMIITLFSACASQQSQDPYRESDTEKAVISNTKLGLEYMNRGQYEVAMGKLKKAIREDPGYAPAHTVMAVLYERLGEQEMAGKHYKKAFEADPKNGDVNNNYGVYLCQNGEEKRAIEYFLRALDDPFYNSPSVALTNAGSCALGEKDYAEADNYLRRALKIEADFPDALINMSRLSFEQENYLSARAFLQRYEAVASHTPETLLLAYKIETASGNERAANAYRLMLETNFSDTNQAAEVRRLSGR